MANVSVYMVGYTVYKPFPRVYWKSNWTVFIIYIRKQLDKTRTCLEKTLKNYSSDNPLYILKLTIIYIVIYNVYIYI